MKGKRDTEEGVGSKGCGGGSKQPRRHYGPRLRRQNGGSDQDRERRGRKQQRVGSKKGGQQNTSGKQAKPRWTDDLRVARSGMGRDRGRGEGRGWRVGELCRIYQ